MISSIYSECFSSYFIFVLTQLTVYFSLILFSFFHILYCSSLSYFYPNFYTHFSRTEMVYPLSLLDLTPYPHWVSFRTGFDLGLGLISTITVDCGSVSRGPSVSRPKSFKGSGISSCRGQRSQAQVKLWSMGNSVSSAWGPGPSLSLKLKKRMNT